MSNLQEIDPRLYPMVENCYPELRYPTQPALELLFGEPLNQFPAFNLLYSEVKGLPIKKQGLNLFFFYQLDKYQESGQFKRDRGVIFRLLLLYNSVNPPTELTSRRVAQLTHILDECPAPSRGGGGAAPVDPPIGNHDP